jgi:hypothetical protein
MGHTPGGGGGISRSATPRGRRGGGVIIHFVGACQATCSYSWLLTNSVFTAAGALPQQLGEESVHGS